jgi:GDP-4-dehydro-6-deoxy-D-mannose reductase
MDCILVTGANGFVGLHLISELLDQKKSVIAVGGPKTSPKTTTQPNSTQYINIDLRDKEAVASIDFKNIAGVIHLAGLAAVGPSFATPLDYITTNIGIEINLFEAALAQKASPRFLIISSGSLYNPKSKLPLAETSPVTPSSPYAVSKLGQEQMAQYYQLRGFDCVIARPFNHIGPGQGLGFIVPDLAQQIIAAKNSDNKEIKVGNLTAKRDYTDVRDIVKAYILLLEKGRSGEIYNVCSGKSLSGKELLAKLLAVAMVNLTPVIDKTKIRPVDSPNIYGSHQKITQDTGWTPNIPINQTLKDVIDSI